MTFVVTVLIGAGLVFVASSLDNTPLTSTFQKIMKGQTINWTGQSSSSATTSTTATSPVTVPLTTNNSTGLTSV